MATTKYASKENLVSILKIVRGWIKSATSAIPFATKAIAGKVKVGDGLNVDGQGVVSVDTDAIDAAITGKGYQTADEVKAISDASAAQVKSDILGGAVPETLDTLKEISDWVNDHNDVASGLTNEIAKKANSEDVYTKTVADTTFAKAADVESTYVKSADLDSFSEEDIQGIVDEVLAAEA